MAFGHSTTPPLPPQYSSLMRLIGQVIWTASLIVTLGFSQKYRERLYHFELMDPGYFDSKYQPYSDPPSYQGLCDDRRRPCSSEDESRSLTPTRTIRPETIESSTSRILYERAGTDANVRSRQAEEWNKLSTATSVITATSAAALAIPGLAGPGSYWVVNTCFCAALGVSIETLILVFYIQIMISGASDETLGRLARGRVVLSKIKVSPKLPAVIMGLPVVFATYSSLFLLIGTIAMVVTSTWGPSAFFPRPCYYLSLVPISFGLVCMCSAVVICEAGALHERKIRRENAETWHDKRRSQSHVFPPTLNASHAHLGPTPSTEYEGRSDLSLEHV